MPRERSPNRDKAKELWLASGKKRMLKDVAKELGVSEEQIRKWKSQDKWDTVTLPNNSNVTKRKRGGQPGNKNTVGHKSSVPLQNKNAEKHGFFSKYLPEETLEIMQEIETKSPIDLLWDNIVIQYTAIIRAQKLMYVKDQDHMTKVLKRTKDQEGINSEMTEREYELQFAWDKQANFLAAQSKAMLALNGMIKQYEELVKSDLATEEQRLRIEKLKVDIEKTKGADDDKPIEIIIKRKGEAK